MRHILIIGATSAIATATARLFAAQGHRLYLVARDAQKLQAVADDLAVRGADRVASEVVDLLDFERHESLIGNAQAALGALDTALIAHGTLPDQRACETSFATTRSALESNAISVISLLTHLANHFERQRRGSIAVISSVAGDRGRQSNYVYGTAKGAVSLFLQGLRNRLYRCGVDVITIKPGFVDTPMTVDMAKGSLWAQPETIAHGIVKAIERRRSVVYLPGFWAPIMWVIRSLPETLFKRLRL